MFITHNEDGVALVMETQEEINFITGVLGGIPIYRIPTETCLVPSIEQCYNVLLADYSSLADDHGSIFKETPQFISKEEWKNEQQ